MVSPEERRVVVCGGSGGSWPSRGRAAADRLRRTARAREALSVAGPALYAELQRALEALGRGKAVQEILFDVQSDLGQAVLVSDGDKTLFVNDAATWITGHPRDALAQMPSFLDLLDEDERGRVEERIRLRPGADSVEVHADTKVRRADDQVVDVEVMAKATRAESGVLIVALLRDISDRKRAEAALRRQTELYNTLLEAQSSLGQGLAITENGRFVHVNDALCDMYGYSRAELLAVPNFLELVAPEARDQAVARYTQRLAGQPSPDHGELPVVRKDGRRIIIEYSTQAIPGTDPLRHFSVLRDVTERRQARHEQDRRIRQQGAQKAMEAERTRAAFLAEAGHTLAERLDLSTRLAQTVELAVPTLGDWAVLHLADEAGRLRPVSAAHADLAKQAAAFGLRRRFPIDPDASFGIAEAARTARPVVHAKVAPEDLETWVRGAADRELLATAGMGACLVVPLVGRQRPLGVLTLGRARPIDGDAAPEVSLAELYAQRAALAIENARLYEQRTQAEHELRRFEAIVASSQDAIISWTPDGSVLSWNPAAERLFGYRADEVMGRPVTTLVPPDRQDPFRRQMELVRGGQRVEPFETARVTRDGERIQVSMSLSPILDSQGNVTGVLNILRDVTERAMVQDAIQRQRSQLARHLNEVEALASLARGLVAAARLEDVYEASNECLRQTVHPDAVVVVRTGSAGSRDVAYAWGLGPDASQELASALSMPAPEGGNVVLSGDARADGRLGTSDQVLARHGIESIAVVPVNDARSGSALVAAWKTRQAMPPSYAWLLESLGESLGAAIRRLEELVQTEQALALWQDIADAAPWAQVGLDSKGRVAHANGAFRRLVGRDEDLTGLDVSAAGLESSMLHAPDSEGTPVAVRVRTPGGRVREARAWLVRRGSGDRSMLHAFFDPMDAAPAVAPAGEADVLDALDSPDVALIGVNAAGRVRHWSTGAEALFGWSSRDAVGRRASEMAARGANGSTPSEDPAPPGIAHQHERRVRVDGSALEVCVVRMTRDAVAPGELAAWELVRPTAACNAQRGPPEQAPAAGTSARA